MSLKQTRGIFVQNHNKDCALFWQRNKSLPHFLVKRILHWLSTKMGICASCLSGSSDDYNSPDLETRRRQQAEAAEKRQKENEGRGIKDPEALKRKQQKREEIERKAEMAGTQQEDGLRWQVG